MYLMAAYFIFIACTFVSFVYLFPSRLSFRDAVEMLAAAIFWPIITLIMLYIISVDKYREYKFDNIRNIVKSYGDQGLDETISRMNLRDLKALKKAALLGFYDVSSKNMELIESKIIDRKFEDMFLNRDNR